MSAIPLRLVAITSLVMIAFAGNSLLNRMALAGDLIDPLSFASLRVISGFLALFAIMAIRAPIANQWKPPSLAGVGGLMVYLVGFSFAYINLDTGLGALILFACVQLTMFGWVVVTGGKIPVLRWAGMLLAMLGLILMLFPTGNFQLSWISILLMIIAGIGWGAFSIVGAGEAQALPATAWTFLICALIFSVPFAIFAASARITLEGLGLAIMSGAITSGIGYALWYRVLPQLGTTRAALSQLTVPVIATLAGIAILGEIISLKFVVASALVIGGTFVGLLATAPKSN